MRLTNIKSKLDLQKRLIGGFVLGLFLASSWLYLAATAAPAYAVDVPMTMGYQGRLKDSGGTALSGTYDFTIRIYDALAAGNLEYTETHTNVTVTNGFFTLVLGSVDPATNPLDLNFDETYFISTEVDGDGEMTPRTKINSAAYALRAGGIETAAADPTASSTSALREGRIYFNTGDNTIYVYSGGAWIATGGGGGGAPINATYLVTSANGSLTNEVVTSSLAANLTFAGNDAAARTITFGQTGTFDDLVVIDAGNWSVDASGNTSLDGTLAVNGDTITSDGATLVINAGGTVDVQDTLNANSLTLDTGGITVPAGQGIDTSGAGALVVGGTNATSVTIGSGSTTAITLTTDGTGNAEVVLPTGSISGTEILDDTVTLTTDTNGNYVASITNGSGISGGNGGSEGAGLTLALGALSSDWNQTGAFDISLNNAGSELEILESAGATFFGTLDVGDLAGDATYTFSGDSGTVLTDANFDATLDAAYLQIANDLSDLNDPGTARDNLGLGTLDSPQFTNVDLFGGVLGGANSNYINLGVVNGTFEFARSNAGAITLTNRDNDANADLIVSAGGTGGLTLGDTGSTTTIIGSSLAICNDATCDTVNIGTNADADAITIGNAADTVIISSANWSIDTDGDLVVNSCTGCGGGGATLQTAYDTGATIETNANVPVLITETTAAANTNDLLQLTLNAATGGTTSGDALQITMDADDADGNTGHGIHVVIDQAQNTGHPILIEDGAANDLFFVNEFGDIRIAADQTIDTVAAGSFGLGTIFATSINIGSAGVTAIALATDGTGDAEVALPAGSIGSTEILDNTVSASDLSATITFADDDLINLAAINNSDTAEGLILPQAADCSAATAEGQICWDTAGEDLYMGNGTTAVQINGGVGSGAPDDATYLVTSANGTLTNEVVVTALTGNLTIAGNDAAARTITFGQTGTFDDLVVIDAGNWSVDASGNTSLDGTLAVNGDTITSDGATLVINAGGAVDVQDTLTADSIVTDTGGVTVPAAQGLDTSGAGALTIGNTNATSLSVCNSAACDTITIGTNADADAITIGDASDNVAIVGDQWSITDAGVLTVVSCTGCGGGGGTLQQAYNAGATIETASNTQVLITETTAAANTNNLLHLLTNPATGGTMSGDALMITLDAVDANGNSGHGIHISVDVSQNTGQPLLIEEDSGVDRFGITEGGVVTISGNGTGIPLTIEATAAIGTGLDITDTDFTTGISLGDNDIVGTVAEINFTDFDVDDDGKVILGPDTAGDALTITSTLAGDMQALVANFTGNNSTQTAGIIDLNVESATNNVVGGVSLNFTFEDAAGNSTVYGNQTTVTVNTDAAQDHTVHGEYIDLINNDAGSTVNGLTIIANDSGTGTIAAGILIDNQQVTDIDLTDGILIRATTADSIVDGLDVSDGELTNSINVGSNPIVGVDIILSPTDQIIGNLTDNIASALLIQQGSDSYISINTTNSSEAITFGNTTTNPVFSFTSNNTVASNFVVTAGGDIDVSFTNQGIFTFDVTNTSTTSDGLFVRYLGTTDDSNAFVVYDEAADTTPFVIEANGEVGIGIEDPSSKLEVVGDTIAGDGNAGSPNFFSGYGGTGQGCTTVNVGSYANPCGVGGGLTLFGGSGGENTGSSGSGTDFFLAGDGSSFDITAGAGGSSTAVAASRNGGGNGGSITILAGPGGDGVDQGGDGGNIFIGGGAGDDAIAPGDGGGVYLFGAIGGSGGALGHVYLALDNSINNMNNVVIGTETDGTAGVSSGKLTIHTVDAFNDEALVIDSEESTTGQAIFVIQTDATSGSQSTDDAKFQVFADGRVSLSLEGTATSTEGVCVSGGDGSFDSGDAVERDAILTDCSGTPAVDYMEIYPVEDGVEIGDVLVVGEVDVETNDGETIKQLVKSTTAYDYKVIGIASNPAMAGDFNSIGHGTTSEEDNPWPVALNGRVPVKIATDSFDIEPGDLLTTSTQTGRAMKATQPGQIIGKALESWSASNPTDTIMVFVSTTYADANSSSERYKTNIMGLTFGLEDLKKLRPVLFDWKNTDEQDFGFIAEEVAAVNPLLASYRNGEVEGVRYKLMSVLLTQAVQEQQLQIENLYSNLGLVMGDTLPEDDNVEIVDSPANQKITVLGHAEFGSDTVGRAVILEGDTSVKITFENEYAYQPIVTATPRGESSLANAVAYAIVNETTTGFEIEIENDQSEDIEFNWHAFAAKEGKVFISDGRVEDITISIEDDSDEEPNIIIDDGSNGGNSDDGGPETDPPADDEPPVTEEEDQQPPADHEGGEQEPPVEEEPPADDGGEQEPPVDGGEE